MALIPSRSIRQMLAILLELNSKGLQQSSGREKESCCLLFPSSTKREIKQFHVVVVQWRQRNVQKSVMHVQSCCFSCLNLLILCRSRCCRRRRCVNALLGTLRSNDATATRTSLKKRICVLSVFIAIIPTLLLCQL